MATWQCDERAASSLASENSVTGWLIGSHTLKTIFGIFVGESVDNIDEVKSLIARTYPSSCEIVGTFAQDKKIAKEKIDQLRSSCTDYRHCDEFIFVKTKDLSEKTCLKFSALHNGTFEDISVEMSADVSSNQNVSVNLEFPVSFSAIKSGTVAHETEFANWRQSIRAQVKRYEDILQDPSLVLVCSAHDVLVRASGKENDDTKCQEILKLGCPRSVAASSKNNKRQSTSQASAQTSEGATMSFTILQAHPDPPASNQDGTVTTEGPCLSLHRDTGSERVWQLKVDVLSQPEPERSLQNFIASLLCSAIAQIQEFAKQILNALQKDSLEVDCVPTVLHFHPLQCCSTISTIYPLRAGSVQGDTMAITADDAALVDSRTTIHKQLGLVLDRPLFRICLCTNLQQSSEPPKQIRLRNPHTTLKPSGVVDGVEYITQGYYDYYHYMQDKFDDNGWGCAYRSFQSIASWFVLNGYQQIDVPGHVEIQTMCVKNDCRGKDFVGSKQWIGSMEVGWLLQWYFPELDITNKYMTSILGEDIALKGRELAKHFKEQGTPVMIGGNNLAHTILGVDFNEHTGDIKFLVLDPHYTGGENLKTIQDKGWCAWKDPKFWKANVTYNLCFPQRPLML